MDEHRVRQLLEKEREHYAGVVQRITRESLDASATESTGALSSYDQHPADEGNETYEREKDYGLRLEAEAVLDQIDEALARLENGEYGVCVVCGNPIAEERLEVLPHAARCFECAQTDEEAYHRPAEELVLYPPFGRTFKDDEDQVGYDGEDTWQDVARWGTSNSPQDVPDAKDYEDTYIDADEAVGYVGEVEAVVDDRDEPEADDEIDRRH